MLIIRPYSVAKWNVSEWSRQETVGGTTSRYLRRKRGMYRRHYKLPICRKRVGPKINRENKEEWKKGRLKEKTTLNRKVEVSDTEESESDQSQVEEKDVPKSSTQ